MRNSKFLIPLLCASSISASTVREIAGDFVWCENLAFDGLGNLFVTDAFMGQIWRISADGTGNYSKNLHIGGLDAFGALGLTPSTVTGVMYATGVINGSNVVLTFRSDTPNAYAIVAPVNATGIYEINGLALDQQTGDLYATSLGQLSPGKGTIWKVQASSGKVETFASSLWASDGAWIDQANRLFYVSEMLSATVQVYDLDGGALLRQFVAPNMEHLDDLTLDSTGDFIYGADLLAGAVVKFAANGTGTGTLIAAGLQNVTSVRFGSGPGFNQYFLYATEGGGQATSQNTRRVLEIAL